MHGQVLCLVSAAVLALVNRCCGFVAVTAALASLTAQHTQTAFDVPQPLLLQLTTSSGILAESTTAATLCSTNGCHERCALLQQMDMLSFVEGTTDPPATYQLGCVSSSLTLSILHCTGQVGTSHSLSIVLLVATAAAHNKRQTTATTSG